jgi:protoheme IX farnesyltransferase
LISGEVKGGHVQNRPSAFLKPYLELCKRKISLFSALSSATGYILAGSGKTANFMATFAGVFLLACGACALNHFQERQTDALMERTRIRPIPSGTISPFRALYFSLCLLMLGGLVLMLTGNTIIIMLGLLAIFWYNGLYTYLKRKSAFAAVPGALVGAIPPAIGWLAGGGSLTDYRLFAVCFFFFMWQVPHFWLLLLSHQNDYEKAGLPSMNRIFKSEQLVRITFVWIFASAVTCLLIPLYELSSSHVASISLFVMSVWLVWNGLKLFKPDKDKSAFSFAFKRINIYMILVQLSLNVERIF